MSHSSSMSTTREVSSQGALEDLRTPGDPISFGPVGAQGANPFWSERVRDDMALQAQRPAFLPPASDSEELVSTEGTRAVDAFQMSALRVVGTEGSMEMRTGNFSSMQRGVPSFEQPSYRQDLGVVLRAILTQNQELAQEVARLRKQVEGGSGNGGLRQRLSEEGQNRNQIQDGAHQERFRAFDALSNQGGRGDLRELEAPS